MQINVEIKNVYGKELIYPSCEVAKTFCSLTNKKTLDKRDISLIKQLGYDINLVNNYKL